MENNNTPTRWQRIKMRFLRWWLFTFKNKTFWECEIGGFRYKFRKYWLDIKSIADNHWNLRIGSANYAYGFLLAALAEMQKAEAEGDVATAETNKRYFSYFTTNLYLTSGYILSDTKFTKGLLKEIEWANNRVMRQAQAEAAATTKEQNDADEALMQSVANEANMTRQQRRKAQREQRKAMQAEAKNIVKGLKNE